MRELTTQELEVINGGSPLNAHLLISRAFDFGALGVLIKAVTTTQWTLQNIGKAFAIGAGVGACYAAIKSVLDI